jgi:hypothetical protein
MKTHAWGIALVGLVVCSAVLVIGYVTPARNETFLWLGAEFLGAGVGLVLLLAGTVTALMRPKTP